MHYYCNLDEFYKLQRDRVVKAAVELRIAYADEIVAAANQTLVDGSPINRPMWWVDPTDPVTFSISDRKKITYLQSNGRVDHFYKNNCRVHVGR